MTVLCHGSTRSLEGLDGRRCAYMKDVVLPERLDPPGDVAGDNDAIWCILMSSLEVAVSVPDQPVSLKGVNSERPRVGPNRASAGEWWRDAT
jgi:hypothetical protein